MDSLDPSVKCTSRSKARILDLFTNISSKRHRLQSVLLRNVPPGTIAACLKRRQSSCHQFNTVTAGCLQIVPLAVAEADLGRGSGVIEGVFKGAIAICLNYRATARRLAESPQMESKLPKS